ncbi:TonB-dependent receptor [Neisseria dumasiana]|uniref:TonB-dependent receptor n=1 Tax=Neisseria dumasiana TaxID=1931275 RepID=UPI000A18DFBD|nr:TonB-dependent siderophore receptor [Neisseria dumasiana]OSI16406.1 TonB-dependent siderophore receptor [Neisseria dumasiana]
MPTQISLRIIPALLLVTFPFGLHAETSGGVSDTYSAVLPTIQVVGQSDTNILKGYVNYDEAAATRNGQPVKEIPQSIDILNIQKNKNYGTNDLSSILEGNAGIDAAYDMRGESLFLRGFQADGNDIYRDGVRESGQVRRSTANIERVEILKGPASVLYGRTNGGGIINMVSRYANFKQNRTVGAAYGSYAARSLNLDINEVLNENVAVRLNGEIGKANSFRSGIDSKNAMLSPSVTVKLDNGLKWTGQYTYDRADRTPDRSPSRTIYEKAGISHRQGFAHPNDFVQDKLQIWRSNLEYAFNPNWHLQWQLAHRRASQDFDHFYGGTLDEATGRLKRNYAWQQTENKTLSSSTTLNGDFKIGLFDNHLTVGFDVSREERNPKLGYSRTFTKEVDPHNPLSWPPSGRLLPLSANNRHKADSYGLFAQNIFSVTPDIKLVAGGRYDSYKINSSFIDNSSHRYRNHTFSPNLGAVWNLTPAHTLYAGYNKGFSPLGGRTYLGLSSADEKANSNISPEFSKQYEAGIKSSWLDNRLSTTLAAYQIERYNIRYRPDPVNSPYSWAVSGKHRSRGVELGALGQIAAKWYLRGSIGVMQAKVVEDTQNPQRVGRHLNNTSNITGNLFVRYTPTQNFYGELGVTGTGKRYYYANNNTEAHIPGFARVDALAGWNRKNLNFTLAVNNLLNQKYWRSDAMPGAPRGVTARVNYRF